MIPKVIHYCWFGRKPLPKLAQKCIASWRMFFPDYEIKEWNEDNFDVNMIQYTKDAYEAKKYAFVSDYARFWLLYHNGGLYFDTDVEVIKSFDDIVSKGSFMGLEIDGTKEGEKVAINPGLCLGAEASLPIYKDILAGFGQLSFYDSSGNQNNYSMIPMVTELFIQKGLKVNGTMQNVSDVIIYPSCYFNPYDAKTGTLCTTEETHSIHWYTASWQKRRVVCRTKIMRLLRRLLSLIKS